MNKDLVSGIVLLGIAAGYYVAIGNIAQSSLSDEVGPHGMPLLLAGGLGVVATALTISGVASWMRSRSAAQVPGRYVPADDDDEAEKKSAGVPRALGVVACGLLYIGAAWLLGYAPAVAVLILVMALYEGIKPGCQVAGVALGGAALFWVIFVKLLGVAQPVGILFGG